MSEKKVPHFPRNWELAKGLMRFSRARMYHKRGIWLKKNFPVVKKEKASKDVHMTKAVGGEKNGGERRVLVDKPAKMLPPFPTVAPRPKRSLPRGPKLRATLVPGTVVILLAGRHKGKRCVFLKQMEQSGLLLVTGPMKLNNCPMRRVSQRFVLATKTRLDVDGVQLPEHVTDDYFRRAKRRRRRTPKDDAEIFASDKAVYEVSEQRKADQKAVDSAVLEAVRQRDDKKLLFGYLGSYFALRKGDVPHKMTF